MTVNLTIFGTSEFASLLQTAIAYFEAQGSRWHTMPGPEADVKRAAVPTSACLIHVKKPPVKFEASSASTSHNLKLRQYLSKL